MGRERNPDTPEQDVTEGQREAPSPSGMTLSSPLSSGQTVRIASEAEPDTTDDAAPAEQSQASPQPQPVSWASLSPEDRKRLLDEADPDELRRHDRIAGLSGQHATRLFQQRVSNLSWDDLPESLRDDMVTRVRRQIADERDTEQSRALGEQGEYYTLGQRRWEELQRKSTEDATRRAEAEAQAKAYRQFEAERAAWAQENLAPEVIDQTARELNESGAMTGKGFREQYDLWLKAAMKNQAEFVKASTLKQEREKWEREELPAHRSRWLAERNGGEATPESDEGTPPSTRDLTDEMIAAMPLKDFQAIWDMDADKPKEGSGYRYKPTNAVGIAALKSMGGRG